MRRYFGFSERPDEDGQSSFEGGLRMLLLFGPPFVMAALVLLVLDLDSALAEFGVFLVAVVVSSLLLGLGLRLMARVR